MTYLTAALKRQGFDLLLAENGPDCLMLFEELHPAIDLVLLDVSMPGMSGVEVARRLFEITAHPNIILMTGYTLEAIVPEEIQRLCGLLRKPFSVSQLREAVEKCLEAEKRSQAGIR